MPQPPTYPYVHIDEPSGAPPPIRGVATSVAAFVGLAATGPVDQAVEIRGAGDYQQHFGERSRDSPLGEAVHHFFLNGGQHAHVVRTIDNATRPDGHWLPTTVLDGIPRFNLLCLPPPAMHIDHSTATWASAASYAHLRHALLLIDAPVAWQMDFPAAAQVGMDALRAAVGDPAATSAAVYFPRIRMADPEDLQHLSDFAPCGAVAGVIARTDMHRGVWKVPAGMEAVLSGVTQPSLDMTDAMQGTINPLALNGLRRRPGAGTVVWGARTLAGWDGGASDYRYVPVRRLSRYIGDSVEQGLQWAVFEPNGEPLWARIRAHVGSFMDSLFREGALAGRSSSEAWFVRCGRDTTGAQEMEQGMMRTLIGFAPLKPAEFVVIDILLWTAG